MTLASFRSWRDLGFIVVSIVLAAVAGLIVLALQDVGSTPLAVLWAFACVACGSVVGFLFGIPRVLQQDGPVPPQPAQPGEDGAPAPGQPAGQPLRSNLFYRMQVNTNLEQISDWLTKIIVGIGLIELRRIPELIERASGFMAQGLGAAPGSQVLAAGLLLYFAVLGFLGSYMITRVYLAGAFRRADVQNIGGSELTPEDERALQRAFMGDLQDSLVDLKRSLATGNLPLAAESSERGASEGQPKIRSILWVDDHPKSNSLMIERLTKMGVEVVISLSTDDAMAKLRERRFDIVISDMRRQEGGVFREAAGVELTARVRAEYPDLPILIYCSRQAVERFGSEARNRGARVVTHSSTELLTNLLEMR